MPRQVVWLIFRWKYEQRRSDFAKLNEDGRRVAKRATSTPCREYHREHVNGILNYMEAAERCGNNREVSRLTRLLSGRRHTRSINPSKYLNEWMNGPRFLVRSLWVRTPTRTGRWRGRRPRWGTVSRPYDAAKLQDVTVCLWRHIVGRWRRRSNWSASAASCGILKASHACSCAACL